MLARPTIAALIALSAGVLAAPAGAQNFPQRSIRIVVPFAPGGANDNAARVVAQKLNEAFGQAVVVDNRPGGATNVGTDIVAKAPADGHTLLVTNSSLATNVHLYKSLPVRRAPRSRAGDADLHDAAGPRHASVAAGEIGARSGRAGEGAAGRAHLRLGRHRQPGPHLRRTAQPAGRHPHCCTCRTKAARRRWPTCSAARSPFAFTGGPATMELMRAGRLRILATTGPKRFTVTPDIPTIAESGVPGYDLVGWVALFATAGTPPEIIARLNAEALRGLAQPDAKKRIEDTGAEVSDRHAAGTRRLPGERNRQIRQADPDRQHTTRAIVAAFAS